MPIDTRGGDRHSTKARVVRIPDDIWDAAKAKAEAEGVTMVDVVKRALSDYARPQDGRLQEVRCPPPSAQAPSRLVGD